MQLALDVQIPKSFGGAEGTAVYLGESTRMRIARSTLLETEERKHRVVCPFQPESSSLLFVRHGGQLSGGAAVPDVGCPPRPPPPHRQGQTLYSDRCSSLQAIKVPVCFI